MYMQCRRRRLEFGCVGVVVSLVSGRAKGLLSVSSARIGILGYDLHRSSAPGTNEVLDTQRLETPMCPGHRCISTPAEAMAPLPGSASTTAYGRRRYAHSTRRREPLRLAGAGQRAEPQLVVPAAERCRSAGKQRGISSPSTSAAFVPTPTWQRWIRRAARRFRRCRARSGSPW
jgi:hypothetical protein